MEHHGTTQLRNAAAQWSLDGDTKLLELLKNIHEKVVHKCKETNSMIDQMIKTLDEANIDIQSVNNSFMSLSNNQFVESRVYGDDLNLNTDLPAPNPSTPPATPRSEISLLKSSLQQLENHHDVLEIFPDTDSDSDDEDNTSVVLKPKNVYADRPLPFIIGTTNWRNKWHAGTIPSESESSSVRSRSQISQYSESGSEPGTQPVNWPAHDDTVSSGSISPSPAAPPAAPPVAPPAPAQIASELARRLGNITQPMQATPVYEKPKMDTSKIYKPEAPVTGTIFSDEPPPLPQISDTESDQFEEDNDIFAELHKTNKRQSGENGGLHNIKATNNLPVNQKSSLFQEESEPELCNRHPKPQTDINNHTTENITKKPIGGISLFGSNKGTESIGAAILKRHQRKSSSDDESVSGDKPVIKSKPNPDINEAKKQEKNIIEDLFSKSKVNNKNEPKIAKEIVKNEVSKVDLFKDDIFDDIDDIFSSNIISKPKNEANKQKSIFDDDDQLFSDIGITKKVEVETPSQSSVAIKNKGLFDSDDELFSDKVTSSNKSKEDLSVPATSKVKSTGVKVDLTKKSSIFGDSSDDDIFFTVEINKPSLSDTNEISIDIDKEESPQSDTKPCVSQFNDESHIDTSNDNENRVKAIGSNVRNEAKHVPFHSTSIFDDDDDDLFSNSNRIDKTNVENNDNTNKNAALESKADKIINEEDALEKKPESIEDDGVLTDGNNEENDQLTTNNTNYEIDIDKYYSNTYQNGKNEPIRDKLNKNPMDHSVEIVNQDITDKDLSDLDVVDTEAIVEEEKKKLDLEKSLEESLFRHNDSRKPEVLFADEPPAFEKPKEPKKSQNINALFDDDSDDETLFFKKEDPIITDEKPEILETIPKPNLFGIFQDEPPDFDFTQKEDKVTKITESQHVENVIHIVPTKTQSLDKDALNETNADSKKVGKLKINLNINVNTLLPGASPKKTPKPIIENTSKETVSVTENPASIINEIPEAKAKSNDIDTTETDGKTISTEPIPKSVSFDKNPESNVLDNQLSKQRAKIQVKRRPSSRRARHEAVRKSIRINQDESPDSTDNSSSIDDQRSKGESNYPKTNKSENKTDYNIKETEINDVPTKSAVEISSKAKTETIKDENVLPNIHKQYENKIVVNETKQKEVKNIVYVLNDEDIFNTYDNLTESSNKKTNEQFIKQNEQKSKILTIVDDDTQLFQEDKQIDTKKANEKSNKTAKSTLFDDSSDDEALFKSKTQNKKPVTIFGSDSDDDLFFSKKKETKTSVVERKKETVVKKTLFSDDEDDLFGVKTNTGITPSQVTASTSTARTSNPLAVDDPFSNLEDTYTF